MIRICLKGSILIIAGAILRLNCEGSANPGGRCGLPRRTEVTCGNPACKCAKGERHGPIWYLTVTLGPGRTTGGIVPEEKVAEVRGWIENYYKLKDHLEKDFRYQPETVAAPARPATEAPAEEIADGRA